MYFLYTYTMPCAFMRQYNVPILLSNKYTKPGLLRQTKLDCFHNFASAHTKCEQSPGDDRSTLPSKQRDLIRKPRPKMARYIVKERTNTRVHIEKKYL